MPTRRSTTESPTTRVQPSLLSWKPFYPPDVDELKRMIASGAIKPMIDRRCPLDQVADALTYVHQGHARGKVLVSSVA